MDDKKESRESMLFACLDDDDCKVMQEVKTQLQFFLVKLVAVVEGDQKAPFSIATTPKCQGGHHSFPWIAPLYP